MDYFAIAITLLLLMITVIPLVILLIKDIRKLAIDYQLAIKDGKITAEELDILSEDVGFILRQFNRIFMTIGLYK